LVRRSQTRWTTCRQLSYPARGRSRTECSSCFRSRFNHDHLENRDIIRLFKLTASLLELHDENPFKIRGYNNAVSALERTDVRLFQLSQEELERLEGIGKGMASKIREIQETGSFQEVNKLLEETPPGVVEMLRLKGIGPKKIRSIWKDLGVDTTEMLLEACESNRLSSLKGFGAKTQETVRSALLFAQANKGKRLYAEVEGLAAELVAVLKAKLQTERVSEVGEMRRRSEIIQTLEVLAATDHPHLITDVLADVEALEKDEVRSGPFTWRGTEKDSGVKVEVKTVAEKDFYNQLFLQTGSPAHLAALHQVQENLLPRLRKEAFASEEAIYAAAGWPYVEPELREGRSEIRLAREKKLPELLAFEDLRGALHNHSTYSDGTHALQEMALACRDQGYNYLGISDHSKTAFYAGGLPEFRVREQHQEIDRLNQELAPFRIFKGIESDILPDGALDYDDDVLASFDFIVASIHGNLQMEERKATDRLLKAIENPYTTILGHPTGRLLLRREGYPIDHKAVIDACAAHGVIMEINANPWRLDLDWRWVEYALEQEVLLSINPDAHSTRGYADMRYGVLMGRKGGLSKAKTFNAWPAKEVAAYFDHRKSRIGVRA
jgi:DNA polymerase (family 10)